MVVKLQRRLEERPNGILWKGLEVLVLGYKSCGSHVELGGSGEKKRVGRFETIVELKQMVLDHALGVGG